MIEKITLRVFWVAMILCAVTALTIVWYPPVSEMDGPPFRARLIMTFFVIGLASLLTWAPIITYRFYGALREEKR